MSNLKILVVSVEVAPFAKVGGLADVAASLPKALRDKGHDARIIMPGYGMVTRDSRYHVKDVVKPFPVQVNSWWTVPTHLQETEHDGVPVWLLSGPELFESAGRSEEVYSFGRDAYLYFAKAVIEACERANWIPDVVHCNDWHTGFLPVVLRELGGKEWESVASVMTIHNLAYQGDFGKDTLDILELPESLYNMHQLENYGGVNFLKSGCVYADQVNTVSPTYAREIQTEEYGVRQWGLMRDLAGLGRLRGILNGIDLDFFDPRKDEFIAQHYSETDLSGKDICKDALQKELDLPVDPNIPILSIVSRLSNQKGFDILIRAAYGILSQPAQLVVLGVGDPWAAEQLRILQDEWPDRVRFIERFDAPLAQRIYAGSDIFLMPSSFEPCGLGQLIALRYGTLPVARRTGGLADTVFEGENGFVFESRSARELLDAICRAIAVFKDKPLWKKLQATAMVGDYGWDQSADAYLQMYQDAVSGRKADSVVSSARRS